MNLELYIGVFLFMVCQTNWNYMETQSDLCDPACAGNKSNMKSVSCRSACLILELVELVTFPQHNIQ